MAFRAFNNLYLSLWQSAVNEAFASLENREVRNRINDATADYCEEIFSRMDQEEDGDEEDINLNEVVASLGDRRSEGRDLSIVSAFNHFIAMAASRGNFSVASNLQTSLRPFEEGIGNASQWKKCVIDYLKYVSQVQNGPMYRLPEFDGHLMENFSVVDNLISNDQALIAVVGDWGTGEPEAVRLLDGILSMKPDVLIHLGDVYFSGTPNETYQRFFDLIRSRKTSRELPVFVLPGNHDYYSGGQGFYQLIDHLNEPPFRQAASFFCLRNDNWQILGMDTGYNDAIPSKSVIKRWGSAGRKSHRTDVRDEEYRWHEHQLDKTGGRRTILLSHHQLFSAYDRIGKAKNNDSFNDKLLTRFHTYFNPYNSTTSRVHAWFWGHEHDFVPMLPGHKGLDLGLCIGHGSIPVDSSKHPRPGTPSYAGLDTSSTLRLGIDSGGYFNHGFSIIKLEGSKDGDIGHFEVDEHGKTNYLGSSTF